MKRHSALFLFICSVGVLGFWCCIGQGVFVSGYVFREDGRTAIAGARVTLFQGTTENPTFFREVRTDVSGFYSFADLPSGIYKLGAMARGFQYVEVTVPPNTHNLSLLDEFDNRVPENQRLGVWNIVGELDEQLDGTGSGMLLPDGKIWYCHNAQTPHFFIPRASLDEAEDSVDNAPGAAIRQGCHGPVLLPEGLAVLIGGLNPVIQAFNHRDQSWETFTPRLAHGRFYPGVTILPTRSDYGKYLILGGGLRDGGERTSDCEILEMGPTLDKSTLRYLGTTEGRVMLRPADYSPAVLIYKGSHRGKILKTHLPPEFFDPITERWQPMVPDFVQTRLGNPGHSDHSICPLSDGNILAVGHHRTLIIRREIWPGHAALSQGLNVLEFAARGAWAS